MTRALTMTFKTADNKSKSVRVSDYQGDPDKAAVEAFMTALAGCKQFAKLGVNQFAIPGSAHAVDTESTEVYQYEAPEA